MSPFALIEPEAPSIRKVCTLLVLTAVMLVAPWDTKNEVSNCKACELEPVALMVMLPPEVGLASLLAAINLP